LLSEGGRKVTMETRAKKAALADVGDRINRILTRLKEQRRFLSEGVPNKKFIELDEIIEEVSNITNTVKEYELEEELIADLIERIYEGLMRVRRYSEAASIAKKYGL